MSVFGAAYILVRQRLRWPVFEVINGKVVLVSSWAVTALAYALLLWVIGSLPRHRARGA